MRRINAEPGAAWASTRASSLCLMRFAASPRGSTPAAETLRSSVKLDKRWEADPLTSGGFHLNRTSQRHDLVLLLNHDRKGDRWRQENEQATLVHGDAV